MNDRIKISITGKNPSYFLKEIIKKNINIYQVEKSSKELSVIIENSDLETIKSIKTSFKIKIIERYGLNRLKYLLKKYYLFLLFLGLGILLNILLSNLIFDIEVVHNNQEIINTITKDLNRFGLKKYHFKVSYRKKEEIKNKLLAKEKELLEWVEIEEIGTKYLVKVEQRKKNKGTPPCIERNIVAKKNALIKEIQADTGEIIKSKNDYVVKGETLISGLIHNKENIVAKKCATGKVYGEVWYTVTVSIPKKYQQEKFTGEEKRGLSLTFFNKELNILNNYRTFKKEEYNILGSTIVPINVSFVKYKKTDINTKTVTVKNVDEEALKIATNKIKKQIKKDEEIISKKVLKKTEIDSKIKVDVFFKIKEDITDYRDISNLDIEKLNQESDKKEEWLGARTTY